MALLSVRDAAEQYGLSIQRIGELLRAGVVKGRRFGRTWAVDSRSLERYMRNRRPPGRPRRSRP